MPANHSITNVLSPNYFNDKLNHFTLISHIGVKMYSNSLRL